MPDLAPEPEPEPYVRAALAGLEADFRAIALLALADWAGLEVVSADLFRAVAALQRPTWGSWNGLLAALRVARRGALRTASPGERARIEGAAVLERALSLLDERLDAAAAADLRPLAELARTGAKRLTLGGALEMAIALRNRIAHDLPAGADFWRSAAGALGPLVALVEKRAAVAVVRGGAPLPAPWFVGDGDEAASFGGLAADQAAVYLSRAGVARHAPERTGEVLGALQRLLGKAGAQERDWKKLLADLAPEEIRGVVLGDYLVGRPAGRGGFATVHVGRQLSTGRRAAVKILHDGLDEDDRARFQQEAAFLSRFGHANIVAVYGYGEEPWAVPRGLDLAAEPWFEAFRKGAPVRAFIALEWIEGRTLEAVFLDPERPPPATLAAWFADAAAALAAVHATGLIHRDVKPSNIMVAAGPETDRPTLKLMDFGIARSQEADRTLRTTTGRALGTPAYMSPEQLRAASAAAGVGPASDVYSLCASFYELFTGVRVFRHDREPPERISTRKLQGELPEAPRLHARGLAWELETILLGGLEPEPRDRYASATALEGDLRRFLGDEPILYRRPSLLRRARLAYRRNRALANVVAAALLLGGAGAAQYVRALRAANVEVREARDDALAKERETRLRLEEARQSLAAAETYYADALAANGEQMRIGGRVNEAAVYFAHALARREDAETRRKLAALPLHAATALAVPGVPLRLVQLAGTLYCAARPSQQVLDAAILYPLRPGERGGAYEVGPSRDLGKIAFMWQAGHLAATRAGRLAAFVGTETHEKIAKLFDPASGAPVATHPLGVLETMLTISSVDADAAHDATFILDRGFQPGIALVRVPDEGAPQVVELDAPALVDARFRAPAAWLGPDSLLVGTPDGFARIDRPFGPDRRVTSIAVPSPSGGAGAIGFLADGEAAILLCLDGTVRRWSAARGFEASLDTRQHPGSLTRLLDLGGGRLVAGGFIGFAILPTTLAAIEADVAQPFASAVVLPDGRLATLGHDAMRPLVSFVDRRLATASGPDLVREIEGLTGLTVSGLRIVPR